MHGLSISTKSQATQRFCADSLPPRRRTLIDVLCRRVQYIPMRIVKVAFRVQIGYIGTVCSHFSIWVTATNIKISHQQQQFWLYILQETIINNESTLFLGKQFVFPCITFISIAICPQRNENKIQKILQIADNIFKPPKGSNHIYRKTMCTRIYPHARISIRKS